MCKQCKNSIAFLSHFTTKNTFGMLFFRHKQPTTIFAMLRKLFTSILLHCKWKSIDFLHCRDLFIAFSVIFNCLLLVVRRLHLPYSSTLFLSLSLPHGNKGLCWNIFLCSRYFMFGHFIHVVNTNIQCYQVTHVFSIFIFKVLNGRVLRRIELREKFDEKKQLFWCFMLWNLKQS